MSSQQWYKKTLQPFTSGLSIVWIQITRELDQSKHQVQPTLQLNYSQDNILILTTTFLQLAFPGK